LPFLLSRRVDIFFIKSSLNSLVDQIELWNRNENLSLSFHGIRNKRAAWTIGNLMIGLILIENTLVKMEYYSFKGWAQGADGSESLHRLIDLIRDAARRGTLYILDRKELPIRTLKHISKFTLLNFPPSGYKEITSIPESERTPEHVREVIDSVKMLWREEQIRLTMKTPEEAIIEFFGTDDLPDQVDALSTEETAEVALRKKAKGLGIRPFRLERWDRLIKYSEKNLLTQTLMAKRENLDDRTIKLDFKEMRKKVYYPK
jgi:hypothetical protein